MELLLLKPNETASDIIHFYKKKQQKKISVAASFKYFLF